MVGLIVSLALLGLAAFDPIGIAAMPILLLQKNPFKRSLTFLGGSLFSLILMGLLFARGFGATVLHFENSHPEFIPSIETIAGIILLAIAGNMIWRMKMGKLSVEPGDFIVKHLQLRGWQLFIFGSLLVAFQSVIDVVFVIAMIRVGQLHLQVITLLVAVVTYAVAALIFQFAVVAAFRLTPPKQRVKTLDSVHSILIKYSYQGVIGISLLLGFGLLVLAF
jgi:hypothetical protein